MEVYEDERYLHLITELCTGGELFDRIIAKTQSSEGHFSEHDAAKLVADILDAIGYCHSKGYVMGSDILDWQCWVKSCLSHEWLSDQCSYNYCLIAAKELSIAILNPR